MAEFKTWLEAIESNRFDEWTREQLINEMPHTHFVGPLPRELEFLQGLVDLGFENLGLPDEAFREIMMAFGGKGVRVPGTTYRLRHARPMQSAVEPADGTEPVLPKDWKQAVFVMDANDKFTWIGKRVRPDQIGKVDMSQYQDAGEGFVPKVVS